MCLVYELQKAPMYICTFHYKEFIFLKVSFLPRKKALYFPLPLKELESATEIQSSYAAFKPLLRLSDRKDGSFPKDTF